MAQYGYAPMDDLDDPERVKALESSAQAFEDVAEESHRLASAEAWFRAGTTWLRAGNNDRAATALAKAYEADRGGIYTYAAGNRLAIIHRQAGENEKAAELYRELASDLKGFLAEQALLDLMDLRIETGDTADIQKLAAEFRARFDASPRLAQVDVLEARAAGAGS
jgi:tetratricopeptide (TPR) repeat protein